MFNRFPQITCVFDRRKTASLTVKSSVEIRITYNRKQKYISTGVMLYSNQWKNGKIVNCKEVLQVSQVLDTLLGKIRQILIDMLGKGEVDIFAIQKLLDKEERKEISFIQFCKEKATIKKYGKKKDTQERYDRFIRLFSKWKGIKSFDDVTETTVIAYDKYLSKKEMKPYSKWNNYHRFLSGFIQDAIEEGFLKTNPYSKLGIERGSSETGIDKCLSLEEFRKIKSAKMPTESLSRVRDLFVFQTYTCLRYSDLALFDARLIKEIKGKKVYIRNSKKTNKPFTVPILPTALDILIRYDGCLPIISNVKYNLYLKSVAQAAGVDKPISTHWARHSGATLLLNEGVDMNIIKKICGHSSVKITEQIYAKLLDETVVDAVQDIDI